MYTHDAPAKKPEQIEHRVETALAVVPVKVPDTQMSYPIGEEQSKN